MSGRKQVCVSSLITRSARFLTMPPSARLLYYDLLIDADDDGIVEGFTVARLTGATSGDLQILVDRGFVVILLADEMITYIIDWRIHNSNMRSDRKIDSIYQSLLLKVLPSVQLLEAKPRADRKNKKEEKHGTSMGRPMDTSRQYNTTQDKPRQFNTNNNTAAAVKNGVALASLIAELANQYGGDYVDDKVALLRAAPNVNNPGAWLRRACEHNYRATSADDVAAIKANPDCPICHGTGRQTRMIGDTGQSMTYECDCVRRAGRKKKGDKK